MSQAERHLSDQELIPLVDVLAEGFIQRWDKYPKQLPDRVPSIFVRKYTLRDGS